MNRIVEFIGRVIRQTYSSENYKMYAVDVDRDKYPDIKFTVYGNAIIGGNLHSLTCDAEYYIKAEEKNGAKGYKYEVQNIRKTDLKNENDVYIFLQEILTFNQASELYKHYPNIVDLVVSGRSNEFDLNKLHGIKQYTFNIIKDKIIENYALFDLIAEFKGVMTISMMKRLYDKYPSIEKIRIEMRNHPYKCLCGLSRVGFKTADVLLLEMEKQGVVKFAYDLRSSKERCYACMLYFLEENQTNNGNTKMNLLDLRKQVDKLTPACVHNFVDCIKENEKDIYYNIETMDIALRKTYELEKFVANELVRRLINNKWYFNVNKYRNVDGIDLSDEQMGLLKSVCENNITVLTAPAGAGKSFSTKALINMMKDNDKTFLLASPTGKAAKRLSEYTGEIARTIHRTLCFQNGVFTKNEEDQLDADLVLLDEVGMTDIWLFAQLLKAIPDRTKIVLVGDKYQLNSIGCGALLRDLISTDFIPQVNFTKIFRMGKGGVLTACTYVRENHKFITENKLTQLGEDKSYTFIPIDPDHMNNKIVELYKELLKKYSSKDITVISSYNVGKNGCLILNQLLHPIANPNANENNECVKVKQDKLDVCYYVGDSVISNVNNYQARIYLGDMITDETCFVTNGSQGYVTKVFSTGYQKGLIINFDGVEVYYSYGDLSMIKHGFAVSVHKMQGSQNKIIIFCCPSSHVYFLSNNMLYTAISRAEKYVFHFSDEHTINVAMKKSDSEKRQTMLQNLLKLIYEGELS